MSINIRHYQENDEDVVVDLWSKASIIAHPFIVNEGVGERERMIRDVYLKIAENWVIEDGGNVVGLLGLLDNLVGGIFIHPDAQMRGLGRQLICHAVGLRGVLNVEVFTKNIAARRFYEKMDFYNVECKIDEMSGFELTVMVRDVDPQ